MEFLQTILPIIIYVLLIILLIIGIILGIKSIKTMNKVERVVEDVNDKVQSLNGFFNLIDFTTDKIVSFTDRVVDVIAMIGSKLFFGGKKKKNKKDKIEEE